MNDHDDSDVDGFISSSSHLAAVIAEAIEVDNKPF